jgi:hypothetical protein
MSKLTIGRYYVVRIESEGENYAVTNVYEFPCYEFAGVYSNALQSEHGVHFIIMDEVEMFKYCIESNFNPWEIIVMAKVKVEYLSSHIDYYSELSHWGGSILSAEGTFFSLFSIWISSDEGREAYKKYIIPKKITK